ncbi:receptor-like protein 40, partial [Quercus suber]
FLRNQDQLKILKLSQNNIHGQIPKWISNLSKDTLIVLEMSDNLLTSFDHIPNALIWTNLQVLFLPNNKLQGSLPIPPPSILYYSVFNNILTGDISQIICELSSLSYLDVSYNNLTGRYLQWDMDVDLYGVFVGQIIIKRKSGWFIKSFAIGHPTGRRVKCRRR